MTIEMCIECEDPVERTGEEALYIDGEGPFCEKCFDWRVLEEEHEAVVKELKAEIERLKEELQAEKQSAMESIGAWQITAGEWGAKCHHLQTEVAQLKAHTWEQERAAVMAWLRNIVKTYELIEHTEEWPEDVVKSLCDDIERGEHWSEKGKG